MGELILSEFSYVFILGQKKKNTQVLKLIRNNQKKQQILNMTDCLVTK